MGRRGCLGSIFTNIFLALLIIGLYHATQPGSEVVPAAAPVYRGSGERIALQFTVSWNAAALSDIMDTLLEQDVHATFAVSGEWAEQNHDILKRMAEEGHEIAIMGYYPSMDGGVGWVQKDLKRTIGVIKDTCGLTPKLYYVGSRSAAVSSIAAKKLGLTQVSCTIDLLTAKGQPRDILARIPKDPIEGSIILLQPTAACGEALPGILAALEQKGLKATGTGDVLGLTD